MTSSKFKITAILSSNQHDSRKAKKDIAPKVSKKIMEKLKNATLDTSVLGEEVTQIHHNSIQSLINYLDSDVKAFIHKDNVVSYKVSDSGMDIKFYANKDLLRLTVRLLANYQHHYKIVRCSNGEILVDATVKPVSNRSKQF